MRRPPASAAAFLAGLVLAASLAACSAGAPAAPPLSVFGPWRGDEAAAFRAVLDRFEEESGIEVRYTGTGSFPSAIAARVEEGDPPDVAVFPQPALLEDLVDRGYVRPLRADIAALAQSNYLPTIAAVGATTGGIDGVLVRVSVKSLVWYRPDVFSRQSYPLPATWEELNALAARMAADGYGPWCLGLEAFDADGWPATDWVEDIVLRFAGTEVYDRWVRGTVPFTDDAIAAAVAEFGRTALAWVGPIGGRGAVINTAVARAQDPMFEVPPRCLMYRQASFQVDNLPDGAEIGPDRDVDVFVLPGLQEGATAPLLIGGSFAAALTDRPEAFELLRFLASPESGEAWADRGGFISPFAGFDPALYASEFDSRMAALLAAARVVRFDASDLMYPPVGTGSFFEAMISYTTTGRLSAALQLAQSGYEE